MEKWFLLLLIPIFRFLIYLDNALYLRGVLKWYEKHLAGIGENATEDKKKISEKAAKWIQANQLEIKRRVINAGVPEQFEVYMEPIGFGYGVTRRINPLDNLLLMDVKIQLSARQLILTAKGNCWTQARMSFNPLFWIGMIIFLPREMLKMVGFDKSSKEFQSTVKVVQLIYWVVMIFYLVRFLSQ